MHELINNQRKIAVETKIFEDYLKNLFGAVEETRKKWATIAFISDRKMRRLNNQFRGRNSTTDVLSFPFETDDFLSEPSAVADGFSSPSDSSDKNLQPSATADGSDFLGDIIISLEQAKRQADENDSDLETEIKQLILHGILHLCGYDHETDKGEMNERELELRNNLNI